MVRKASRTPLDSSLTIHPALLKEMWRVEKRATSYSSLYKTIHRIKAREASPRQDRKRSRTPSQLEAFRTTKAKSRSLEESKKGPAHQGSRLIRKLVRIMKPSNIYHLSSHNSNRLSQSLRKPQKKRNKASETICHLQVGNHHNPLHSSLRCCNLPHSTDQEVTIHL